MAEIVVVEDKWAGIAGVIAYWSLSGSVDIFDLEEALEFAGFDVNMAPSAPSAETALHRAAEKAITNKRQMVRPLDKRGSFVLVQETVVNGSTEYEHQVTMRIGEDGQPVLEALKEAHDGKANLIWDQFEVSKFMLTAVDISGWLLDVLSGELQSVSLRPRGGFYFVGRDKLETWRKLVEALHTVSDHRIHEIPAMKADETVEAILTAVRHEAETEMAAMEEYLAGEISTRGLNAYERRAGEVQKKVAYYAELLGVSLPQLTERAELLLGAVQAARIMKEKPDATAVS